MFFFSGLNKKKEQYEAELESLGSIRDMHLKESEASGKISGLEKKIQYAEIEKVQSNKKADSLLLLWYNQACNSYFILLFVVLFLFFLVLECLMCLLYVY